MLRAAAVISAFVFSSCGLDYATTEVSEICGDRLLVGYEECDDGNETSGDGCSLKCRVEAGYLCRGEPSLCERTCGEDCLEGASGSGDGYPATCDAAPSYLGDGWCDPNNNTQGCGFDGGDCCMSTCDNGSYGCGYMGFDCLDPAACENSEEGCDQCAPGCFNSELGNGQCDPECYNPECSYDAQAYFDPSDCTCDALNLHEACDKQCVGDGEVARVGDGTCDMGESGVDFNCGMWSFDGGDCLGTGSDDTPYPDCSGYGEYVSDGWCDGVNNNKSCGFDGGDCCESTCGAESYQCGYVGFDCQDPEAVENLAGFTGECEAAFETLGDGVCHYENNLPNCAFDGGDCCLSTNTTCDSTCHCLDPEAEENQQGLFLGECLGNITWVGDGWCDGLNNVVACGFDGGDCCSSTCNADGYVCGENSSFHCVDPEAVENSMEYSECQGDLDTSGDRRCDVDNNNQECGFDGGDCCEASNPLCGTPGQSNCDCLDPSGGVHALVSECGATLGQLGDGACDPEYNSKRCGFDGGDCCESTNAQCGVAVGTHQCQCLDPQAVEHGGNCTGNSDWMGDGWCDSINNNGTCGFDGGDCCGSTCTTGTYVCGAYVSFDCEDPDAFENLPTYSECNGDVDEVGDGACHVDNNTLACGWDGGDCCLQSCVSGEYLCGTAGFQCLNPIYVEAPGDDLE